MCVRVCNTWSSCLSWGRSGAFPGCIQRLWMVSRSFLYRISNFRGMIVQGISLSLSLYCCRFVCNSHFFFVAYYFLVQISERFRGGKIHSWDSRTEGASGEHGLWYVSSPAAFEALRSPGFLFKEELSNPGRVDKQGINWLPGKPEWKASLLMESVDLVCLLHIVL